MYSLFTPSAFQLFQRIQVINTPPSVSMWQWEDEVGMESTDLLSSVSLIAAGNRSQSRGEEFKEKKPGLSEGFLGTDGR